MQVVLLWAKLCCFASHVLHVSTFTLVTGCQADTVPLCCLFPARAAVLSISGGISPALAGLCLVYALDMTVSGLNTEVSGSATLCGAMRLPHPCRTPHV